MKKNKENKFKKYEESDDYSIKDYEMNEAVLVTRFTLDALYRRYYSLYPKKIGDKLQDILINMRDYMEREESKDYPNCDIENSYYLERIIFKTGKQFKNK